MKTVLLIPCYNEALTVGKVISDFRSQLPDLEIYVYDNNSTDGTDKIATEAGAIVRYEHKQGKANVVRSMFREIDADIYIMVDGDNTYPADQIHQLLDVFKKRNCDMVIGDRMSNGSYLHENKRGLHNFGNILVKSIINFIFNAKLKDIMTGYRIFSKRFVKNYPVMCHGFELETEMTIFALNNNLNLEEVPINFIDRPEGSFSKLHTFSDGKRVIMTIFDLFRHYKPFHFFGIFTILFFVLSISFGIHPIIEFYKYHYVYKVPSAILASGLMLVSLLSFAVGLILDTIAINDKKIVQIRLQQWN